MRRIFACNYATLDQRAAAVATWIRASLNLGAPLKTWTTAAISDAPSESLRKDLGARQGWKVTINDFTKEYWGALFAAAIAGPADPGLKGDPAARQLHTRDLGTALRLLQIEKAATECLASATFIGSPGSWFLFDPKTGLWQAGDDDVDDFCNHMEANYKGQNGIRLRAWVVPIPVNLHSTWIGFPTANNNDILCASAFRIAKFSADIFPKLRFCCFKKFKSDYEAKLQGVELVFLEDELPALNTFANGGNPPTQPDFNDLGTSAATILWEYTKYLRTGKDADKRLLAFAKDLWSLYCLYKFGGYHFDAGVSVQPAQQANLAAPSTFGAMLAMEGAGGGAQYLHLSAADYSGSANAGINCMFVSSQGFYAEQLPEKLQPSVINVAKIDTIDVPVLRSPLGDSGIKRALQTYIYLWFALQEAGIPMTLSTGEPAEAYRLLSVSAAATGITHWAANCPAGGVLAGSTFAIEREMNLRKKGYQTHRVPAADPTQ